MIRARDAAAVALLKLGAAAVVLLAGFRAVSDDDFARVVIAEQWARAPRVDPSGTSWLPFPFWVTGAGMALAGRGLDTARGVALALGIASAVLVLVAAGWLGADRRAALAGAAIAAVFPWSARLGVATVPELPTAALALLAMASLAPAESEEVGARRLAGGAALLAATLSRYEVWPIAAAFALLTAIDARRSAPRARLAAAAGLALAGPLAWMAWNLHAHGDAFHFVARVTAYKKALGGEEPGALARLVAYPAAMLREEPELWGVLAVLLLAAGAPALRARLPRFGRPLAIALAQVVALSLAMVKDGAPTHHPERAVLVVLLLAALVAGELAVALASAPPRRRALALAGAALALAGAALAVRPRLDHEGLTPREDEVAIGREARARVPAGAEVLVEVADYGHLAIVAAFGRPEAAVLDRSIDPRDPRASGSFGDAAALIARLRGSGATFAIARPSPIARAALGEPTLTRGAWALWKAPEDLR